MIQMADHMRMNPAGQIAEMPNYTPHINQVICALINEAIHRWTISSETDRDLLKHSSTWQTGVFQLGGFMSHMSTSSFSEHWNGCL